MPTVFSRRLLFLAAAGLLVGCGVTDPSGGLPPGDAQLAILNALPEGTVSALILDGEQVSLPASGQRISRVVAAGNHSLLARGEGGRAFASTQFTVAVGGRRTAILGGSLVTGGVVIVAGDTASLPGNRQAKVRLVNTVADTPPLEGWLGLAGLPVGSGVRLVSPFAYGVSIEGAFPDFVVRGVGNYLVRVTDLESGEVAAKRELALGSGEVWSVVLIRLGDGLLELVAIQET